MNFYLGYMTVLKMGPKKHQPVFVPCVYTMAEWGSVEILTFVWNLTKHGPFNTQIKFFHQCFLNGLRGD